MTHARRMLRSAAALVGVLTVASTQAHHSYSAFDQCTPVTLEGEIAGVEWANPHIRLRLHTPEAGGYIVEWFSLIQLQQAGIEPETLQAGDHVVIAGSAMRDPSKKILSLITEIRRPSDGWTWGRARQRPDHCAPATAAN